jgi:pyridoxal phosphate enzyme (YggS family)
MTANDAGPGASIRSRLDRVHARIDAAARSAGRDPAAVRLVAVSKKQTVEAIREAYAAGQRAFGESYAQELEAKASALADLGDVEWHFIGGLQSNKAKIVAQRAHVVHSLDSAHVAKELARRVEKVPRTTPLPVLLEVNIGGEAQKHGVAPADLAATLAAVRELPALVVCGLMTVPPAGDEASARVVFDTLVSLRNLHGGAAMLPELSMGMTSDLEAAVAAGATLVRIGTAVFGERPAR